MGLEEEKKLVAEKLMGWKIINHNNSGHRFWRYYAGGDEIHPDNWNPQSDRNQLAEIEAKMSDNQWVEYVFWLDEALGFPEECTVEINRKYRTVPPEVCWKALIKVLALKIKDLGRIKVNTEEEKSIHFLKSLFLICPEDKTNAVIISTKSGSHGTEIITKSEGNLKFKYIVTCSEIK